MVTPSNIPCSLAREIMSSPDLNKASSTWQACTSSPMNLIFSNGVSLENESHSIVVGFIVHKVLLRTRGSVSVPHH